MTREEAIKQLDGADVAVLNRDFFKFNQAIIMAISALRQQEHFRDVTKKVEPLTRDELRQMDGEPVWVEFQDGSGGCWGLVHITMFNHVVFTHVVFTNGLYCTVGKPYFGKTWLTYRQKPEEDAYEH